MNAPTPALVARPDRLRLVGQRRQILAFMHQRLMFGMLVYAGIVALIVLRLLWLAAFGDHAGRKVSVTALLPERGDIVDRDGHLVDDVRKEAGELFEEFLPRDFSVVLIRQNHRIHDVLGL